VALLSSGISLSAKFPHGCCGLGRFIEKVRSKELGFLIRDEQYVVCLKSPS
jgi:hypothetical protein